MLQRSVTLIRRLSWTRENVSVSGGNGLCSVLLNGFLFYSKQALDRGQFPARLGQVG